MRDFFTYIAKNTLVGLLVVGITALLAFVPVKTGFVWLVNSLTGQVELPIGTIVAWHSDAGNPPSGWEICDGTDKKDNVPDLRGVFLRGIGRGDTIETGHPEITCGIIGYSITPNADQHALAVAGAKEKQQINMPPFYTAIYIMKVR